MLNQFRSQKLTWNRANNQIFEKLYGNAGDSNGRKLVVQVINDSVTEDLSGNILSLAWRSNKNQGLDAFSEIDASEGLYEIYYTTEMLSNVGKLDASLVLVSDSSRLESRSFQIQVEKSVVDDEVVQSDNSFTALTQALARVIGYQSDIDDAIEGIENQGTQMVEDERIRMDNLYSQAEDDRDDLYSSAEDVRDNSYSQAESDRNAQYNQAESIRSLEETVRQSNESDRASAENAREDNENERNANESSREQRESTREDNEDTRQSNENIRNNNELARVEDELIRQANMAIIQGWIANPEQFDGKDLEFTWRGTELGVRLEGDTEYVYVDLKGETGSIENLTEQHVINALGFTPLSEDSLPSNLETTSGSQAKAKQAEQNAKDYADAGLTDKVDKVTGKGLSTNDYTTVEKNKLSGIATGAQVNTVTSVAGKTGAVVVSKSDVGLSSVDNIKQMPISGGILENYREKLVTLSGTSTVINLSLGNTFTHSLTGNTTYSISNAVSGQAHSFTLVINMGATARTLTFPASVKWQGGEIPDMSEVNKTYVLTFVTVDGGTTWLGMFGGEF